MGPPYTGVLAGVQKRIKDISPNIHTEKLFPDSLTDESIAPLAADIAAHGLRHPIHITKKGAVIIDGERRWRACKKLGWVHIEVIEEDLHRKQIFERVVEAAAVHRHMSLLDQARLYKAHLLYLTRAHAKGTMGRIEAKHIALRKAQFPFHSITLADRIVTVLENGENNIHERILRGDTSIQGTYERIQRRYGKPEEPLPKPEPSPHQAAIDRARRERQREREEELEFARTYIEAHKEDLASEEAQRRLLHLFEADLPPDAKRYRQNEATEAIAEAFTVLAVKEPPERLAGRLTSFVEGLVASVREVDEQRAREIVREAVKPMVLRLAAQFPRREFEAPVQDGVSMEDTESAEPTDFINKSA